MRVSGIVFLLLSLGLLSGCNTGAPVVPAVEAANKPQIAAPAHNYKLYGSLEKGEFMVDSATGQVWELKKSSDAEEFVPVTVSQAYTGSFCVTDPNGGEHPFDTREEAVEFKILAKLKDTPIIHCTGRKS